MQIISVVVYLSGTLYKDTIVAIKKTMESDSTEVCSGRYKRQKASSARPIMDPISKEDPYNGTARVSSCFLTM